MKKEFSKAFEQQHGTCKYNGFKIYFENILRFPKTYIFCDYHKMITYGIIFVVFEKELHKLSNPARYILLKKNNFPSVKIYFCMKF